jgi:hypothetical protein
MLLAASAGAAAGYYAGTSSIRIPPPVAVTPAPTWVDRELRPASGAITVHCTYHLSDGTTRITDYIGVSATCAPTHP